MKIVCFIPNRFFLGFFPRPFFPSFFLSSSSSSSSSSSFSIQGLIRFGVGCGFGGYSGNWFFQLLKRALPWGLFFFGEVLGFYSWTCDNELSKINVFKFAL